MNWFREAVHERLIRKRGFRREDLKTWTFSDLAWKIVEVVGEEDQATTASWKRELQEVFETGRENRAYWHQRVTEAVAQLQAYHDSLQSGKPVLRAPMPFMTAAFTPQVGAESSGPPVKIPQGHWRIPEPDDVPWACLVLGLKIEALFRVSRLLIPEEVWQGIRRLEHLIENAIWIPIGFPEAPVGATASVDDLKAWWWFIKQDLCHRRLPAHGDAPPPERNGAEGSKQRMGNPQSADTRGKPESPNRVTLAEFIQTYCEGGLTDRRIESLKNSLQAAARNGKLVLPRYTCSGGGEWTKGKRKYYTATSLIQRWADYQRELPSLPPLRPPSTD
jgi:hypothetical protein